MISGTVDLQHICAGVFISLIIVLLWKDLDARLPAAPNMKELLSLWHFLILLVGYIIQANISVARTLLFSNPPAKPVLMVMEPSVRSSWGRVLLATCITITPGTITVDVDPDIGRFIVHAINEETGKGLLKWRVVDEIKQIEVYAKEE